MLTRGMKENSDFGVGKWVASCLKRKRNLGRKKKVLKVLLEIPVSHDLFLAVDENCM